MTGIVVTCQSGVQRNRERWTDCYLAGVSTRRVDKLVKQLGLDGISKSQVSELAKTLDATIEGWRSRPLDASPYTYVWVDAVTQKVREGGRIVNVAVVHAVGVNAEGHRETLGMEVITSEDGAGWTAFLRSLVARGLSGVQLVVSDAHAGLTDAVAAVLPGASWQRCRTHFMRNLLSRVPKSAHGLVAPLVRSIFDQPDQDSAWAQHARIVEQLTGRFDDAAELLAESGHEILAFTAFPKAHWGQLRSNNPLSVNRPERPAVDAGCVAGGRLGWTLERAGEGRADDGAGSGRYREHLAA
jgi:putative transposase